MPLTFAHPAAILPFSRKSNYINFLAMVLGSMSPDFEYFLYGKPHAVIGHTYTGFLLFNLPIVAIVYFIYSVYIHRTLVQHLPLCLQESPPIKADSSNLLKMFVFIYSALFGMITHVVWDSFTHVGGAMVMKFSVLTYSLHVFGLSIPIYKLLQHGSTVVGILAIFMYLYFRAAKKGRNHNHKIDVKQKMLYWGYIVLSTILIFCLWQLIDRVSFASYGVLVVRMIDSGLFSLLVVSIYFGNYVKKAT